MTLEGFYRGLELSFYLHFRPLSRNFGPLLGVCKTSVLQ